MAYCDGCCRHLNQTNMIAMGNQIQNIFKLCASNQFDIAEKNQYAQIIYIPNFKISITLIVMSSGVGNLIGLVNENNTLQLSFKKLFSL